MRTAHRLRGALAGAVLATILAALAPSGAGAAEVPAPALSLSSLATPTDFVPGDSQRQYTYDIRIANLGAEATGGSDITIVDSLPPGVEVKGVELKLSTSLKTGATHDYGPECEIHTVGDHETVTCTISESLPEADHPATLQPYEERRLAIRVFTPVATPEGQIHNTVTVQGGGAPAASAQSTNAISSEPADAGFSRYTAKLTGPDGQALIQAGSHPYQLITGFAVHTRQSPEGSAAAFLPAGGDLKDISVALPPGLAGNPTATPRCSAQDFNTPGPGGGTNLEHPFNSCPDGSVVGVVLVQQIEGVAGILPAPIYNLVPPPGMPAQLGFQILGLPFYIDTEVSPEDDYRVIGTLHNLTQIKRLTAATVALWGNPAAPVHDPVRGRCLNPLEYRAISFGDCPAGSPEEAFLRLPTSCTAPLDILGAITTWTDPASPIGETSAGETPVGCNTLRFEPSLKARPSTNAADSPSGLEVEVALPQSQDPNLPGEADLRKAVVTLPKGLSVNPAGANGLAACSPAQAGLTSAAGSTPPTFDAAPDNCPAAARIGSAEVDTPAVDHTLKGGVYVATPHENPFGSLLALYIAVDDKESGIVVKLAGEVHADPQTGQLTTTFDEAPQQPFEDFKLHFFSGAAAALRTPATCGSYESTGVLTPWSAPESGPPATLTDAYAIDRAPQGGGCPANEAQEPNAPAFSAGAEAPIAAAFSPFAIHLRREDGSQELGSLTVSPPPGLLAKLAGVPYCPEAALAAAETKSGAEEKASPSCPAASRVGTVSVGAGAGPAPYYTQGTAYLAPPYKGAPLSLAVITPASAGPYDLGTVVVRTALHVDPETARVTAVSDPIPHILDGIPLDVRTIDIALDRPQFALNPTSCDETGTTGEATSLLGQVAPLSARFQLGECSGLAFKPKLSLRLHGETKRGGTPALRAVLTMPAGGANLASASVALPHSEFLDQSHIRTICTRVQYAAGAGGGAECPAGSIYGQVVAYSPLLQAPLSGPVILRSSSHTLPDLVFSLGGQIHIDAVARIDSVHGGIRATFAAVPDAPIGKVVLSMQGGARGLLENSTDICAGTHRATTLLDAHNGAVADLRPMLKARCGAKGKRSGHRHRKGGSAR
jgi:hypothetical protein